MQSLKLANKLYRDRHFKSVKKQKTTWYQKNHNHVIELKRIWRREHPGQENKSAYLRRLKQIYNLSLEDYEIMFMRQGGVCAICNKPSLKRLNVDHNHITGKIRGLLCGPCNRALGLFNDKADICLAASLYLRNYDL